MANILNCVTLILYEFKVFCSHFSQSKVCSWKSYWTERNHKGTSKDDYKLNLVRYIWIYLDKVKYVHWFLFFFLLNNVIIGRMPIMLQSCQCVLYGQDEAKLAKLGLFAQDLNTRLFLTLACISYFYVILLHICNCYITTHYRWVSPWS